MKVKEINPEFLVLEYRQEQTDKGYGSCLWARFYFNLDNWELMITSDCGNYGYRWGAGNGETYLELMARCGEHYLREKLCGKPKEFDYEATKERFYSYYGEELEDRAKLDEIFEAIESYHEPESGETFLTMFDNLNVDENNHAIFCDTWEMPMYDYAPWEKRICQIFKECIQPEIRKIVKETKDFMKGVNDEG